MQQRSLTLITLRIYLKESLRYPGLFFGAAASWLFGIALQKLGLPLIVAGVIDRIATADDPTQLQWDMFTTPLAMFVGAMLLAQLLIDVALVLLSRLETKGMEQLYMRVYNHLLSQSMNFHNNSFAGSLVSQANRFVGGYVGIMDTFIMNLSQLVVFVLFGSAVLWFYSPLLAATLFIWSSVFIAINIHLTRKRIPLSKARAKADSTLTGYLADSVSNVGVIKTFSAEKHEARSYHKLALDRVNKGYRYWVRSIANDAVYGLLMGVLQLLILGVSIYAITSGTVTIATFLLAQVYIAQTIAHLWGLSHITKSIEQNLSDASEMTSILLIEPSVKDITNTEKAQMSRGKIEFRDVTFSHAENNDVLFSKLNVDIQPGEKVGLIGRSGSGKTTLTKLLLRFADVDGGEILIDGQNIRNVKQDDLRAHISYVPQEPLLFHRSLAENISYARPEATKQEITSVSKMAHAHEFIKDLPEGYDTLVGERGVKLSGGQRQRVAIARAMLKNAPILVLDEATSALDSESEVLIQDALWKLMEGRTAIVIAHRLSTIQKMDRIIVMENGKIAEQGTHKELIAAKGTYADLWNHQTGGFIEE